MRLYSIFDKKAKIYFNPFIASGDDAAIRDCISSMTYSREFFQMKNDLSLLLLAEWDPDAGTLTPVFREDRFVCDLSSYEPFDYKGLGLVKVEDLNNEFKFISADDLGTFVERVAALAGIKLNPDEEDIG